MLDALFVLHLIRLAQALEPVLVLPAWSVQMLADLVAAVAPEEPGFLSAPYGHPVVDD